MQAGLQGLSRPRRVFNYVLAAVLVTALTVFCVGMPALWIATEVGPWRWYTVTTLDVGEGRAIAIYGENSVEYPLALWYEVRVGDSVVVPKSSFKIVGLDQPRRTSRDFRVVQSRDKQIVGIVDLRTRERVPNCLVIMHNFESGGSWPGHGLSARESRAVGEVLFKKLQQDHLELGFPPQP